MNKEAFLNSFCDAIDGLEPGDVTLETELKSIEQWDSLSLLNVLASMDADFGVQIKGEAVNQCRTVGEVCALVEEKLGS